MAAPTVITGNPGFAVACYDFNDYIPAVDSPVVGGWVMVKPNPSNYTGYDSWPNSFYFRGFGKVCTKNALSQTTSQGDLVVGRLSVRSNAYGWYAAGTATKVTSDDSGWFNYSEIPNNTLKPSCPNNTAPIMVSNYTRSDGGVVVPPIHGYDIAGANAWIYPASYPAGTTIEAFVCVKTDTTQ